MSEGNHSTELFDQAFDLVRALSDEPDLQQKARLQVKIAQFRARSDQHYRAIARAEAEWSLFGQLDDRELEPGEKISYFLQRHAASLADNPSRLAPVAVVLLAVLCLPLFFNFTGDTSGKSVAATVPVSAPSSSEYVTAFGERSQVMLPDGSRIQLNWNTRLSVTYSNLRREVVLHQGEAVFTVQSQPGRPFVVTSDDVRTVAVGTEFLVRKVADGHAEIGVTEGVVEVSIQHTAAHKTTAAKQVSAPESVRLSASQGLRAINHQLGTVEVRSLTEMGAWRSGMLVFEQRPLHEVVAELNRYTPYPIELAEFAWSEEEVTATYFIEQMDDAIRSLSSLFDLHTTFRATDTGKVLVLSPAPDTP